MFDTALSQIGFAVAALICGFAFVKGDEPERVGAGGYLIALFASVLIQDKSALSGPQWGLMAIDGLMLALYAGLAWRSRRAWPVWASALQGLVVMIHVLTAIDARPPLAAFYAVINLASYGVLLALAVGAFRAWRERRVAGLE